MAGVCTGPGPCDTTPFGTGDNWVTKVGGLPLYIRAVAKAFRRQGHSESEAISRAVGVVRNWAEGKGNVTPATRARAAAAIAEWTSKRAASHSLTAEPTGTVDLTFTEQLHPRGKKGTAQGGKFVAKNSSSGGSASPAADTRDFQRRTGLKQTGRYDASTAAKVNALTNPHTGGGGSGGGKSKRGKHSSKGKHAAGRSGSMTAKQAAAARRVNAVRTAVAVNKLTPAQRELFRAKHPKPPAGYRWNAAGLLVAVATNPQARRVRAILARP